MPHQKLFRTASAFLAVVAPTLCLFEASARLASKRLRPRSERILII